MDLSSLTKKARMMDKILKLGFFNSEFQSVQGKKGGKKGGSANTAAQFEARSRVGSIFGRCMGIANQSSELKERLTYFHVWQHKTLPDLQIVTQPAPAALDVIRELIQKCEKLGLPEDVTPNLSTAGAGGFFYAFMKGKKRSYFGWSITLIPPDFIDQIFHD